jgi:hypothetical protein
VGSVLEVFVCSIAGAPVFAKPRSRRKIEPSTFNAAPARRPFRAAFGSAT